jgi:hypothetical protein
MSTFRCVFVALWLLPALATCGGTVSSAPCEGTVDPFTAPMNPPFEVHYGTAIVSDSCEPGVWPPVCDTAWVAINVFFTPAPTSCPSLWLSTSPTTDHDVSAIWLQVQVPAPPLSSSVVGTYVAKSDPWNTALVSGSVTEPFIVSVFLPKGTVQENPGYPAVGANGTITITKFIDGQELAGSFDANFGDGTHLTQSFDVPFCTSACYSN